MLFLGTFDYAMDERGRVPIPPRYRDAFRDGMVLSQGSPDVCVRIYTRAAFESQASTLTAESPLHRKGREARRAFFARTHETELDRQHRILVPGWLREYAGLSGKVLLIGAGECLEIWSQENLDTEMQRVDETLEFTLESLDQRS